MTTTNNNFRVKNGLEVATSATIGTSLHFSDGSVQTTAYTGGGGTTIPLITAAETTATSTATGKLVSISDNGGRLAYYNNTWTEWRYVATEAIVYTPPVPPPTEPPVTDYIQWLDASSFAGSTWTDLSTNNNDATVGGTASVVSVGAGYGSSTGVSAVQGNSSAYVNCGSMPSTYTVFTVARLPDSDTNAGWSFTSNGGNTWLSGHAGSWAGVAYHEGIVNAFPPPVDYNDGWLISADQNYFYRPNGNTSAQGTSGGGASPAGSWGVNMRYCGGDGLTTDWQVAEIIVYDRTLNSTEISDTEAFLADKYGITLGA
jgi:hypothetical protein